MFIHASSGFCSSNRLSLIPAPRYKRPSVDIFRTRILQISVDNYLDLPVPGNQAFCEIPEYTEIQLFQYSLGSCPLLYDDNDYNNYIGALASIT